MVFGDGEWLGDVAAEKHRDARVKRLRTAIPIAGYTDAEQKEMAKRARIRDDHERLLIRNRKQREREAQERARRDAIERGNLARERGTSRGIPINPFYEPPQPVQSSQAVAKMPKDDVEMDASGAGAAGGAGGSKLAPTIAAPRSHTVSSGYGGIGVVGVAAGSHLASPGARCHRLIASLDEHKQRGRKRARTGVERLFEAAEEWMPYRLLELTSPFPNGSFTNTPPTWDPATLDPWRGYIIGRSRSSFAHVLIATNMNAPSSYELQDEPYQQNGMFASKPASTAGANLTPGMRVTENPLIGKLTMNGSLRVQWADLAQASPFPKRNGVIYDIQLHLVRFSTPFAQALGGSAYANAGTMAGVLDAADFDLGSGCESYLNANLMQNQSVILPAGTNVLVAQEDELYPPRRNYKIHWSSPVMTVAPAQEGLQKDASASAVNALSNFHDPIIDISNLQIDIDQKINFDTGNTAKLNSEASNRGDPFDCWHLVAITHPRIDPLLKTARDENKILANMQYFYLPVLSGQIVYTYNLSENRG